MTIRWSVFIGYGMLLALLVWKSLSSDLEVSWSFGVVLIGITAPLGLLLAAVSSVALNWLSVSKGIIGVVFSLCCAFGGLVQIYYLMFRSRNNVHGHTRSETPWRGG
jgi:succinate-acetate transporter protein